ncbi:DUF1800 domain-containing protein [Dinoroseobacter sp. S76]|uniref:DUF1800 domain-containing protein n=1 Tax=Dinoroseobacter sp. S76 TaxID=3415124 RepID=UPI003C7B9264
MIPPDTLAAFRFGYGPSPHAPGARDAVGLLASLSSPHPAPDDWAARHTLLAERQAARKDRREKKDGAEARNMAVNRALRDQRLQDHQTRLAETVGAPIGFDQRLRAFWDDHFTIEAQASTLTLFVPHFHAQAIAPHIAGRFRDMLRAASTHPAMLLYLDQTRSFGPNSRAGQRMGRGLNENLAREILELHTLGVDAAYAQRDVREFAELLTGLHWDAEGFRFRPRRAEPGAEELLGQRYGGAEADLGPVLAALDDLAAHPDTARHLARKLVVHFIGAPAPADLVEDMAAAYLAADTSLMALYEVMLEDPRAWAPEFRKIRLPYEVIVAASRGAGFTAAQIRAQRPGVIARDLLNQQARMGQIPWKPGGPDGWAEDAETWITPVGLAARLRWAQAFTRRHLGQHDPRAFLAATLGERASPVLRSAVAGAESREAGLSLVLASPEFNRR